MRSETQISRRDDVALPRREWKVAVRLICREGQTFVLSTRLLFYFHPIKALHLCRAHSGQSRAAPHTHPEAGSGIEGHYLMLMTSSEPHRSVCEMCCSSAWRSLHSPVAGFPSAVHSFNIYCKMTKKRREVFTCVYNTKYTVYFVLTVTKSCWKIQQQFCQLN